MAFFFTKRLAEVIVREGGTVVRGIYGEKKFARHCKKPATVTLLSFDAIHGYAENVAHIAKNSVEIAAGRESERKRRERIPLYNI